jgi:hypothetical protein
MIVKAFIPFSGAKPFTIMGARYPPLAGAVLQALRAAPETRTTRTTARTRT